MNVTLKNTLKIFVLWEYIFKLCEDREISIWLRRARNRLWAKVDTTDHSEKSETEQSDKVLDEGLQLDSLFEETNINTSPIPINNKTEEGKTNIPPAPINNKTEEVKINISPKAKNNKTKKGPCPPM